MNPLSDLSPRNQDPLTKTDPYASRTHRRIDVILLVITILILFFVLRASAHGQVVSLDTDGGLYANDGPNLKHTAKLAPTTTAGDPTYTWGGGGSGGNAGMWNAKQNWTSGDGGTTFPNNVTNDHAIFTSTVGNAPAPTITLGQAISVADITFNSGAAAFTIGNDANTLTLGTGGITDNATNTETFQTSPIALAASQTWTVASGGSLVVSSVVSGTGFSLTKAGAGTLTLSGANTYTGGTTFNAGTLLVNNVSGSGTGSGSVTVNNGGTLGGTGTISGAVTVAAGGTITGATTGTVGTLTLQGGATFTGASGNLAKYLVNLSGATSDKLSITGVLNLSGLFDQISFSGAADGTTTYVLATYTSVSGTFDTVTSLPSGYQLIYGASELDLAPIPEPSTWFAAALAVGVLAYSQRRRFKPLLKTA